MKIKLTLYASIFLLLIIFLFVYLNKINFFNSPNGKLKEQIDKLTDADRKHRAENLLSRELKTDQKELSAFTNWQFITKDVYSHIKWLNDNNLFFTALDPKLDKETVHYPHNDLRSLFMYDFKKRTRTKLFSDDYLPLGPYFWPSRHVSIEVEDYLIDYEIGKSRKISKFKFSPSRTTIAYMYLEKDTIIIKVYDISKNDILKVDEVTFNDDKNRNSDFINWIDDSKLMIVIVGDTYVDLYIYLLDKNRKSYYRFDNRPGLDISHNGKMVLACYYDYEEKVYRNKLFEIKSGEKILIKSIDEFNGAKCSWSNNDRYISTAVCDVRRAGSCHFKIYDVTEDKIYNIDLPKNDKYYEIDIFFSLKWSPNDSKIAIILNNELWVFNFGKYIDNMEKKGKEKGKKK